MQKSLTSWSRQCSRSCLLIWGVGCVRFSYYASLSCCEGKGLRKLLVKCTDGILLILMITFLEQVNSEKNCEWEDPAGFPKRCTPEFSLDRPQQPKSLPLHSEDDYSLARSLVLYSLSSTHPVTFLCRSVCVMHLVLVREWSSFSLSSLCGDIWFGKFVRLWIITEKVPTATGPQF